MNFLEHFWGNKQEKTPQGSIQQERGQQKKLPFQLGQEVMVGRDNNRYMEGGWKIVEFIKKDGLDIAVVHKTVPEGTLKKEIPLDELEELNVAKETVDFWQAKNLDELKSLIDTLPGNGIMGSGQFYTREQLQERVSQAKEAKNASELAIALQGITDAPPYHLRTRVKELAEAGQIGDTMKKAA